MALITRGEAEHGEAFRSEVRYGKARSEMIMTDEEIQNPRRLAIGGSEIGAIFGCDEMNDAFGVWMAKKGGLPPFDSPTLRMIVGKALEVGLVTKIYPYMTGRAASYCDQLYRHAKRQWQIFTPDALCSNEKRGVEAKVVAWDQRRKWGERADEIPERVRLQCWWYMSALDYPVWDVIALIGDTPRVYTIERDPEAERAMLERVEEWYRRFLIGNERPPLTGSWETNRWLQMTFPDHKRPDIRQATDVEIDLLERYTSVRVAYQNNKTLRALLENQIKAAIADREGLDWPEGRFTWRKTRDSKVTDWEGLALVCLTHFIEDPKKREQLIAEYTRLKPGTRRIHFQHDDIPAEENHDVDTHR